MSTSKIILILGAGGNVGASVAKTFAQNGYKVAIAARCLQDVAVNGDGYLQIQTDLADVTSVETAFDKTSKQFGPPNVVVYNAASAKFVAAESPLDRSTADFDRDMAVNTGSVLAAAKRAVGAFEQLPSDALKTFIYTGNALNDKLVVPALVSNGMGESATAHLLAVASQSYAPKGYRFYYADERNADGSAVYMKANGPNHAQHYYQLAEGRGSQPWQQTFVGGEGYRLFL